MSVKIQVVKQMLNGEQMVVDVLQCNAVTGEQDYANVSQMQDVMADALQFIDVRQEELTTRMLEAYGFQHHFDEVTWEKIRRILGVISGNEDPRYLLERWNAAKEENDALEREREEQLMHAVSGS